MLNYIMLSKIKIHFKTHKEFYSFVFVSLIIYILFFYKLFDSRFTFWSSDAKTGTFPVQIYLSEKLRNFEFPFWSERAYLGYAPYQDSEIGFDQLIREGTWVHVSFDPKMRGQILTAKFVGGIAHYTEGLHATV